MYDPSEKLSREIITIHYCYAEKSRSVGHNQTSDSHLLLEPEAAINKGKSSNLYDVSSIQSFASLAKPNISSESRLTLFHDAAAPQCCVRFLIVNRNSRVELFMGRNS